MISTQLRDASLEVNLTALRHNLHTQVAQLKPGAKILPVVKANAYGNGLLPVVNFLAPEESVGGFCVAILDEALRVRDAGVEKMVLVLGITPVKYAAVAATNGVSLAVGSLDWLKAYKQMAEATGIEKPLKVHLAVDSGMGRIGFTDHEDLLAAVDYLKAPAFEFEGIFTHFATADEADATYFEKQAAKWEAMLEGINPLPPLVHNANSATALWHQGKITNNAVRMGITLYGVNPSGKALDPTWQLEPVTALTARLTFVKKLAKGSSVSYGATYTASEDEWVGTVPVGYADGYARGLTGHYVLIDGQKCPILGRICMDQFMVRLPHEMPVGTKVVLLGKSGDLEITATELADKLNTINYEVLTNMSERLHREYRV